MDDKEISDFLGRDFIAHEFWEKGGRESMDNKTIKKHYDEGALNWHNGFNESIAILGMMDSWQGKTVLEIGCGEGHLASMMDYAGAVVYATDYSSEQIERAAQNYGHMEHDFHCIDLQEILSVKHDPEYDIVVMQGVLEHLDNPWDDLKSIFDNLTDTVILSVPFWYNIRGAVYHTLRILFDAPMSLTDLHYFAHDDFTDFCARNGFEIEKIAASDKSWAMGPEMVDDLRDRIPKAIPDIDLQKVDKLMDFLTGFSDSINHQISNSGANIIYKIRKTS